MKVTVTFEFEGVKPNSTKAFQIVRGIVESCETMQVAFDADDCWVVGATTFGPANLKNSQEV